MDNNDFKEALLAATNEDVSETVIQIFIQLYLYEQEDQEI